MRWPASSTHPEMTESTSKSIELMNQNAVESSSCYSNKVNWTYSLRRLYAFSTGHSNLIRAADTFIILYSPSNLFKSALVQTETCALASKTWVNQPVLPSWLSKGELQLQNRSCMNYLCVKVAEHFTTFGKLFVSRCHPTISFFYKLKKKKKKKAWLTHTTPAPLADHFKEIRLIRYPINLSLESILSHTKFVAM